MSPGRRVRDADVVRRSRTPRLDALSALALVIPLVTVAVLALVRQPPVHDLTQPPALTELTNATLVCPAPVPTSPVGSLSTASGHAGELSVSADDQKTSIQVSTGAVADLPGAGAAVVRGSDDLAPGLLGLRSGTAPLTAQTCSVPSSEQWFTGLGSGADHDSVVELVNPDAGRADADITLYGTRPFTVRKLHGITIPGHKTVTLDLGAIVPRRLLLSAQVQVSRGQLAVHVLDRRTDLASHKTRTEWLPRQDAPALDNQLIGLPSGAGTRTLQVANPGDDVVRAQVKIITGDTSFAPAGVDPISVAPGATTALPLTKVLAKAMADGALGVEVTADGPVTASLLTDLGTDEAITVPDPVVREAAATLLPVVAPPAPGAPAGKTTTPVSPTLYLAADAAGSASVTAYDAAGQQLLSQRVAQQQGHTVAVDLPKGTAYLRVVPHGTLVRGSVVLTGDGATVIPLHELLTRGLVPQISPGLN
ncbi:MAG TPA: DUF5719 family protein [Nocardioides sp.]|nr:DUF5719 family protein [Nocardioides sp.]